MRLHFPSVAVGVVAVSLVLVSMSVGGAPSGPPRIEYGPHPRDMVQIREGTPYVVPAGKLFVLTGVGVAQASGTATLRVNGVIEAVGGLVGGSGTDLTTTITSVAPVPVGFAVPAGSTVEIEDAFGGTVSGRAWGYLANQ